MTLVEDTVPEPIAAVSYLLILVSRPTSQFDSSCDTLYKAQFYSDAMYDFSFILTSNARFRKLHRKKILPR